MIILAPGFQEFVSLSVEVKNKVISSEFQTNKSGNFKFKTLVWPNNFKIWKKLKQFSFQSK